METWSAQRWNSQGPFGVSIIMDAVSIHTLDARSLAFVPAQASPIQTSPGSFSYPAKDEARDSLVRLFIAAPRLARSVRALLEIVESSEPGDAEVIVEAKAVLASLNAPT